MGAFSIWHWIIVLIVVLILFGGKGKLSGIMGDFGKGLRNFNWTQTGSADFVFLSFGGNSQHY